MTGSRGRWLSLLMLAILTGACGGGGATGSTSPTSPTPAPTTGSISGTAAASGSGVANATVTLAGGGTQTTNAQGQFTFSSVPAGSQTLLLAPPGGFELASGESQSKSVTVTAGQIATVSWSLRQASTPTPPSGGVTIRMQATSFVAPDVTIARGDTVTWINALAVPHTITPANASQPGAWPSQNVPAEQGFTFRHTFTLAGTYPYDCLVHAGMTGVVRVQ